MASKKFLSILLMPKLKQTAKPLYLPRNAIFVASKAIGKWKTRSLEIKKNHITKKNHNFFAANQNNSRRQNRTQSV